jgi:hypothetical protein
MTFQEGPGTEQTVQGLAMGWTVEGSEFASRYSQDLYLPHVVQTGSGGPPRLLSKGYRGASSTHCSVKLTTPFNSAEVKNRWIYTSINPHVFMA